MNQAETQRFLYNHISRSLLGLNQDSFLDSLTEAIKIIKKDDKLTDNELREVFAEALA